MSFSIAVAGKGGSGKTSLSSLIIRYLINSKLTPILAIDADPNANLAEGLGFRVEQTVGSIIASFNIEKIKIPAGMTKEAYLDVRLNGALIESKGLDILTMGRGEGPECYCYPNLLLRKLADSLMRNYAYVVMDNEAGMEHLSRRTTQNVDLLLLVSDHSVKGARTIGRLRELVAELKLIVKKEQTVINMVPDGLDPHVAEELSRLGISDVATVPLDETIREYDLKQKSLLEIPGDSRAVISVEGLMRKLLK